MTRLSTSKHWFHTVLIVFNKQRFISDFLFHHAIRIAYQLERIIYCIYKKKNDGDNKNMEKEIKMLWKLIIAPIKLK